MEALGSDVHSAIAAFLSHRDVLALTETGRWGLAVYSSTITELELACPKEGGQQHEAADSGGESSGSSSRGGCGAVMSLLRRYGLRLRALTVADYRAVPGVVEVLMSSAWAAGLSRLVLVHKEPPLGLDIEQQDFSRLVSALGMLSSLTTLHLHGVSVNGNDVKTLEGGKAFLGPLFAALGGGACPALTDLDAGLSYAEADLEELGRALISRASFSSTPAPLLLTSLSINFSLASWSALSSVLLSPSCRGLTRMELGNTIMGGHVDEGGLTVLGTFLLSAAAGRLRSLWVNLCDAERGAGVWERALSMGGAPALEELGFDLITVAPVLDGLVAGLARGAWPNLKELSMWNSDDLSEDDVARLMASIAASGGRPALKSLILVCNPIGPGGGAVIAQALTGGCCPSLETLVLDGCGLSKEGRRAVVDAFLRGAPCAATITRLQLSPANREEEEPMAAELRQGGGGGDVVGRAHVITPPLIRSGTLHAVAFWFILSLDEETELSTGPPDNTTTTAEESSSSYRQGAVLVPLVGGGGSDGDGSDSRFLSCRAGGHVGLDVVCTRSRGVDVLLADYRQPPPTQQQEGEEGVVAMVTTA